MTSKTSLLVALFLLTPTIALAGLTYQPLVGIPGVDNASSNFNQYINQLYFVSISIAALLAVIKIIIGGVKWMLTDVVTQKSDAKDDIRSALLGLLLIIAAYLILSTINPQLTNLNVLQSAPPVQLSRPENNAAPSVSPQAQAQIQNGQQYVTTNGNNRSVDTILGSCTPGAGGGCQNGALDQATMDRNRDAQLALRQQCGSRPVTVTAQQTRVDNGRRITYSTMSCTVQ